MKTLSVAFTMLLGLTVGASLYARDAKSDAENPAGAKGQGTGEILLDLHLTPEQEAKIAEVRKECRPKVQEAAKELGGLVKEEIEKVHALLTPEQRTKVQAMKDIRQENRAAGVAEAIAHFDELDLTEAEMTQIAEIRKEYHPKIEKAMEGLRGVLTDEQRKARQEAARAGKSRAEVASSLNLTDEQKQKLETVGKEVKTLVHEELEKFRGVLTQEQQQKLAEFREERRERIRDRVAAAIANAKDLNLSDEQKNSIMEIRKEFRPKVHEAGNKLRAAVSEELGMILGVLR
jgi:Spy/CpxP family protein refolding chaperone